MSADWALTDAIRDRIYKRKALAMRKAEDYSALAEHAHPQSDDYKAILIGGDETFALITKIALTAGALFLDTDKYGIVWGRVTDNTPGAGSSRWNLYADQARTLLVATFDVADNGTGTLVTQTGYTLAGTVKVGAPSANFDFAFILVPPVYKEIDTQFNRDEEDDAQNEQLLKACADRCRARDLQSAADWAAMAAEIQRTTFRRRLVSRSSESSMISPGLEQLETGQVQDSPSGLLEDERLAMDQNTAGSAEMKASAPTFAAPSTAVSGGNLAFTGPTLNVRALDSIVSGRCVKGLDEDGDPEFELLLDPTDTRRKPNDGKSSITNPRWLRMGATWQDPAWGITALVIGYSPSITNSSGTSLSATATDWSPVGLTSENSDEGKLYTYYDLATTTLEFYKTSTERDARDPAGLVAQVVTTSTSTVFTTQDQGGLVVTGKTGAALADGAKGTVDFRPPVSTGSSVTRFTITLSETTPAGAWTQAVRDGAIGGAPGSPTQTDGGWEPNTGGSPNIEDGWMQAATLLRNKRVFARRPG
jgi:hypothetical protein